ncbi:MAG: hypothetical protein EBZ77_10140, partial [Chitinophagia bacterium]|nr:hypothetical protein [Chitinophagia bacterium]
VTGSSGDGGRATAAQFIQITGFTFDRAGNIYVADYGNRRVRKINAAGTINAYAGGGSALGDGGPATAALMYPADVAVDAAGNVFIADFDQYRVRKVTPSGTITTVLGNGVTGAATDGAAGTATSISSPSQVAVDRLGNVYVNTGDRLNTAGMVNHLRFSGIFACDSNGNIYMSGQPLTVLDSNNYLHTVGGVSGHPFYTGDSGLLSNAKIYPEGPITISPRGELYFLQGDPTADPFSFPALGIRKVCCLQATVDNPPLTINITRHSSLVCRTAFSGSLDTLLTVLDRDAGDTLTWFVVNTPTHGTLSGFPYSVVATGTAQRPSGLGFTTTVGYTGLDSFKVAVTDGVDTNFVTITLSPTTFAGTLPATTAVCMGSSSAYISVTSATAVGTWYASNGNATIAPYSGSYYYYGVLTPVAPGTDTIYYVVSNACGTDTATAEVYIYNRFTSVTASGPSSLCTGSTATIAASLPGGYWSSSDVAVATVSAAGVVSGLRVGTAYISYSLYNSCGSAESVVAITVNRTDSGSITGPALLCAGATDTALETVSGGTWSAASGHIAVSSTGHLVALSAGADTLLYTVTGICGTSRARLPITIYPADTPSSIAAPAVLCTGTTATLSGTPSGGSWAVTDPYVLLGTYTGVVSGVAAGTAMVTYTTTGHCGTYTDTALIHVVSVPSAGTISGAATLCIGTSAAFSTTGTGGTWSCSNPYTATVSTTGVVTGLTGGAVLISYTVASPCGAAVAVTLVNVVASSPTGSITGSSSLCTGTTTTLTYATGSGTWSSSTPSIASVDTAGVVTGVAAGAATISYSLSAGCGISVSTFTITVNTSPATGALSGPAGL